MINLTSRLGSRFGEFERTTWTADFDKFGFWLKRSVKFGLIARRYRGGFGGLRGVNLTRRVRLIFGFDSLIFRVRFVKFLFKFAAAS